MYVSESLHNIIIDEYKNLKTKRLGLDGVVCILQNIYDNYLKKTTFYRYPVYALLGKLNRLNYINRRYIEDAPVSRERDKVQLSIDACRK